MKKKKRDNAASYVLIIKLKYSFGNLFRISF